MDAGPNVHVIYDPGSEDAVVARLEALDAVQATIRDGVGRGPRADGEHLF